MEVKEEQSGYKTGARYFDCGHDYGVIDRIQRSTFSHVDEVYEMGS